MIFLVGFSIVFCESLREGDMRIGQIKILLSSHTSVVTLLGLCLGLCSCGLYKVRTHRQQELVSSNIESRPKAQSPRRLPSAANLDQSSCFSNLIPILNEGAIYSDDAISAQALGDRGLLDIDHFDEMSSSRYWQDVVAREEMSQRDEELGFIALSIIKKRYPRLSDEGLKDRYEVLKAFCGR